MVVTFPLTLNISGEVQRKDSGKLGCCYIKCKGKRYESIPFNAPSNRLEKFAKVAFTKSQFRWLISIFAPMLDHMESSWFKISHLIYFIDGKEEKKRSDENIMRQLLFLDLIGGKISKERNAIFLQNYLSSNVDGTIKEA